MTTDCVVTGPPAVGITSPLGAGGTTNITGVAYSSEHLCRANGTTVTVFWENTAVGATQAGWVENSTGVFSAGAHPTGLVACGPTGSTTSNFYRLVWDCKNDGTAIQIARWYDGVTRAPLGNFTLDGTAYTLVGTLVQECFDSYIEYKSMYDCAPAGCIPFREKTVHDCRGTTVTFVDSNEVVYVPVGVTHYGECNLTEELYSDVAANVCITVIRSSDACGNVTYRRRDNNATWVPTVALAIGACLDDRSASSSVTNTFVTGGTAQTIMTANARRKGFEFQNSSSQDFRMALGGTASATNGFIIPAGGNYTTLNNAIFTGSVSIFAAFTGQEYTFVEYL